MFISTMNATLSILSLIALGYVLSLARLVRPGFTEIFSDYVFYVALPVEIFLTTLRSGDSTDGDMSAYMQAYCTAILILWALIWIVYHYGMKKSLVETGLNLIAIGQTNTAFLAVPIFLMVFGDTKLVIPVIVFQSVVLTSVSVLVMESPSFFDGKTLAGLFKKTLLVMIRNPLIMAALVGFMIIRFGILPLPDSGFFIFDSLQMVAKTASPLALIALGASFNHAQLKSILQAERTEIVLGIVIKTLIHPALAYLIGRFLFGLTEDLLFALTLIAAMPSPKNTFVFAQIYGLSTQKFNLILLGSTGTAFLSSM
jgi:malonate transporter and related proteins